MNDTDVRVLLVGARDTLDSKIAGRLPLEFKVDFVSAAALEETDAEDTTPEGDVVLLDAASIPPQVRQRLVQSTLLRVREHSPRARVLALVPREDRCTSRIAVAAGAWDVLDADEAPERTAERLQAAVALHRLEAEIPEAMQGRQARTAPNAASAGVPQILGQSPKIRRALALLRRVAPTDVPVLITGESGTGKELAARAIHDYSPRAKGPFVPINCAAIPEALLEAELFGYERGAFTGAHATQLGRFETADGGTLFLDEVGELSPSFQVKLLRFLENHVIEHVGGRKLIPVDVRVVAATNQDLKQAVQSGAFREDLYWRLHVFSLQLPPLRERGADVTLLAEHFLRRFANEAQHPTEGFTDDGLRALMRASWPGNVRELINRVRRAAVVTDGRFVTAADLDFERGLLDGPPERLRDVRRSAEASCIRAALERTGDNRSEAARALGISRTQLYELMHRHGIAEAKPSA